MAPEPVQIVWSYDTTGSMSCCLETVKTQVRELSQRLLKDIPGLEIGIVAHGDYCDESTTYLVKTMPFSTKPAAIAAWTRGVGSTGGGDAPEAYEIALRVALQKFAWKPNARKVFAMIGDEVPHTPDYAMNRDRVNWEEELAGLAELGVRCFGVQCRGNRHAEFFYKALAERTDGMWLPLNDLRIIADVFTAVCLQVSDASAFERFRSQLQQDGPVANALVPIILRLARRRHLSGEELAHLCGLVATLSADHGKPPEDIALPVESVEVSAFCGAGGCCEVQLQQDFVNRGAEGANTFEYRFAMPPGAAVFHFEAILASGRRILGLCKGKAEAREQFQCAVARGEKAFLMEENDADLFSMQLGNLEPEERVQIVLRYLVELEEVTGAYRLRLPQHVAPRPGGQAAKGHMAFYPITVTVEADEASRVAELKTLSHPLRWHQLEATEAAPVRGRLTLLPEHGTLNRDLVFDLQPAAPLPALSVDAERCEMLNSTVVRVCLRPPAADGPARPQPRRVALLIDASASMQGTAFAAAHEATKSLLAGLHEDVKCSCFFFRNDTQQLCRWASPGEAMAALEVVMDTAVCGGGSNFIAAFEAVAAVRPDVVVLISDGHGPEKPQETFQKAQELNLPLFCLGVGPDPGAELLEGLAFVSQGTCELAPPVTSPESVAELCAAAKRLAADTLAEPVDLQLTTSEDTPAPQRWPTLCRTYPGRRAVCYLRLPSADASLIVNGFTVNLRAAAAGRRLHRLGAKLRLQELERFAPAGFEDSVLTLALEQGLTSSQTSFVAVEERANSSIEEVQGPSQQQQRVPSTPAALEEAAGGGHLCPSSSLCAMLERGEHLESLVTRSADLHLESTVFYRSVKKTSSFPLPSVLSAVASAAFAIGSAAASLFRSRKSEAVSKERTSKLFEGTVEHVYLGTAPQRVFLHFEEAHSDSVFEGALLVEGREPIRVKIVVTAVQVIITSLDKELELMGKVNAEGLLEGEVGGLFQLSPCRKLLELHEVAGTPLVFYETCTDGAVALSLGSRFVRELRELKVSRSTGCCYDGIDSFTIPADVLEKALGELQAALGPALTVED